MAGIRTSARSAGCCRCVAPAGWCLPELPSASSTNFFWSLFKLWLHPFLVRYFLPALLVLFVFVVLNLRPRCPLCLSASSTRPQRASSLVTCLAMTSLGVGGADDGGDDEDDNNDDDDDDERRGRRRAGRRRRGRGGGRQTRHDKRKTTQRTVATNRTKKRTTTSLTGQTARSGRLQKRTTLNEGRTPDEEA